MKNTIISILKQIDELSPSIDALKDDTSLYDIGLSSFGTVELMVALENAFGVQFPDSLLTRATFESIASISAAMQTLQQQNPAGTACRSEAADEHQVLEVLSLGPASGRGAGR